MFTLVPLANNCAMRAGELPFLPVFHPQMQALPRSWKQVLRERYLKIKTNRLLVLAAGMGMVVVVMTIVLLLLPSKASVELPSPTFKDAKQEWSGLTHLILLPGHGIQWCTEQGKFATDESCWYLESYQKGQVKLFLAHIRRAIEEAANDPKALLVFSGGQTRPGVGLRTEAHSYFAAAEQLGYFTAFDGTDVYDRAVSEDYAKDSLENLMFSVCRFKEITGQYPRKITVVGFPFKGPRFIDLHRKAINFPQENFKYIGVEVRGAKQDHIVDDAYADFKNDLYGCGKKLLDKRRSRNPYHHLHSYAHSCPDMANYLDSCPDL